MKLIVGLGNPGRRYERTRHNAGVRVLERFGERQGIDLDQRRFESRFGRGRVGAQDVGLLAPETWMNRSGSAVVAALRALPVEEPSRDLLVVYDDVDLPLGRLRLRAEGGHGGHRGLQDVLECTGRRDLPRLRFGVGRPPAFLETEAWVLQRFAPEEERALPGQLERAAEAVECFLDEGVAAAMNRFNAAS